MARQFLARAALLGLAGVALLTGKAQAMSDAECSRLPAGQYLAAIERGSCRIDIQTAAGPDGDSNVADSGDERTGQTGEHGDTSHGGDGGGKSKSGGGSPGRSPGAP